jgi:hypothetical protein
VNHIHRLQQTNVENLADLAQIHARAAEFKAHLASEKFNHVAADGSRTDWISTADVNRWLAYIIEPRA